MSESVSHRTVTEAGRVTGWSARQSALGWWHWSAYGPKGGVYGTASSRAKAEKRAQAAEQELA